MADNNETPDWVQDAEHFAKTMKEWEKPFKEKYKGMITKSITFDPIAQANLPKEVKDKMKADRERTRKFFN